MLGGVASCWQHEGVAGICHGICRCWHGPASPEQRAHTVLWPQFTPERQAYWIKMLPRTGGPIALGVGGGWGGGGGGCAVVQLEAAGLACRKACRPGRLYSRKAIALRGWHPVGPWPSGAAGAESPQTTRLSPQAQRHCPAPPLAPGASVLTLAPVASVLTCMLGAPHHRH